MLKKNIYKFTPFAWAFYYVPMFYDSIIFFVIHEYGFNIVNIICLFFAIAISFGCIFLVKYILPTIVIDKKENKIRIENKKFTENKFNLCIPLNAVSHFEIVEKGLKGNKYLLAFWRAMYSDGTKIQQLIVVYKNGEKDLITIRPPFSMINVLKKDFEIKFETKWSKLRYYSYERVYFVIKLFTLALFISIIFMIIS